MDFIPLRKKLDTYYKHEDSKIKAVIMKALDEYLR